MKYPDMGTNPKPKGEKRFGREEAEDNPFWWRCTLCDQPGAMSHNTKGTGPWYCRQHFEG